MAGTLHHSFGTFSQMLRSAKSLWRTGASVSGGWLRSRCRWVCACFAVLTLAMGAGFLRSHAQESYPLPAFDPPGSAASPAPAGQKKPQNPAPALDSPQNQVASECADLLKMATDLKAELDKTTKDTLSVPVVRKAGEIEELARKVRTANSKN